MWKQKIGVLYYLNLDLSKKKIAAFDLDNTIIVTKSNAKFPKDKNDWKFIDSNIISEFNTRLIDYNIVIYTNQKGLDKKLGLDNFKEKIINIIQSFNVKISVFISYQDDFYRKPLTGMWDLLCENINVDSKNSFYVGDAAGRKNDFSNSDINFAHNIRIKFLLPEEFIQNKVIKYTSEDTLDIKKWLSIKKPLIKQDKLELVLLVGYPGCGKSTFSKKYFDKYVYINQDTDKTKEKSIKKVKEAVKEEKSIIIDNTNLSYEKRYEFINLVNNNYKIKIIIFDIPIEVCQYMMYYRVQTTHQLPINIITYRTMNKNYKLDDIKEEENPDKYSVYRINKIYTTKKELENIILFKF
jgi:bifunctional polynucleotide phosphatase/kinase